MSSRALECFLAKLYTDPIALERFFADMDGEARRAGLSEEEIAAVGHIDRAGLRMASASFARKRERYAPSRLHLGELLMRRWFK
ncbi:MAG TPA: hypothetical protein VM532_16510 [Burkholderiales bacterium]|nr:hypothetical protein [Burkholderiales bacterium]